jgi:hypothetical protein
VQKRPFRFFKLTGIRHLKTSMVLGKMCTHTEPK